MDFKTVVLLLAAGQGLTLSLALLLPLRKPNKSNIFLGIIVFVVSIEILNDFAAQLSYHDSPTAFPFWILGSYLLVPPALWMFVRVNLSANFSFKRTHLLLFVPALVEMTIATSASLLAYFFGIRVELMSYQAWFLLAEVLPIVWLSLAMVFYGSVLYQVKRKTSKGIPPAAARHLNKHFIVFGIFLCLTLLWIPLVFSRIQLYGFVEILLVTSVFLLGYLAYANPAFFDVPKAYQQAAEESAAFTGYCDQEELLRLNELLQNHRLYTKNKLSLNELSEESGLPSRYVSYLINTYHDTNFHDFINSFRVQEVIRKINDPKQRHKTLLALGLEAGFSSKSAFNHVFKMHTGKTPSSYLKKINS